MPHTDHARSNPAQPLITILGAGPAGTLLSIFLVQHGYRVRVLERLPDPRTTRRHAGRSINLALAARGIHALRKAGVFGAIEPLLTPMRGRMLHDPTPVLVPYGQREDEIIYSISRHELTTALLDHAERVHGVQFSFRQTGLSADARQQLLSIQDIPTGKLYSLPLTQVVGADGAGSVLRRFVVETTGARCEETLLDHGYKELTIAATPQGEYRMDPHALHVWPRNDFMLIALPNRDGSFTATLFLPHEGPISFVSLHSDAAVQTFFAEYFADALELIPDVAEQFAAHPTGTMGTVRCDRWALDNQLLLIGDAAHAIVPFHGQGMNCAFEDCTRLADLLSAGHGWESASAQFAQQRKADTDAIADLALDNYQVMRQAVRDPGYLLRQRLAMELERRYPTRFIPQYSMVMFHHEIPYAVAQQRGRVQEALLRSLTREVTELSAVDFQAAATLVEAQLPPLE